MDTLRFITCGAIDNGKSTLIGRLLYDSKSIMDDVIQDIQRASQNQGSSGMNLALLTDGLKEERSQGITIDVAYRYFSTSKRRFIIGDTPGHFKYTRNMVTAASHADLALILVDTVQSVSSQTLLHLSIASLMGLKRVVFCLNKMDLVNYSESRFLEVKQELLEAASQNKVEADFIPISALTGENVVTRADTMNWYLGPCLLEYLEGVEVNKSLSSVSRFIIQGKIGTHVTGLCLSGGFIAGQKVGLAPPVRIGEIRSLSAHPKKLSRIQEGQVASIELSDSGAVRGTLISNLEDPPRFKKEHSAQLCWFSDRDLEKGTFLLKQMTAETRCHIDPRAKIGPNQIVGISFTTEREISYDSYATHRMTGSAILVDEKTFQTLGAVLFL